MYSMARNPAIRAAMGLTGGAAPPAPHTSGAAAPRSGRLQRGFPTEQQPGEQPSSFGARRFGRSDSADLGHVSNTVQGGNAPGSVAASVGAAAQGTPAVVKTRDAQLLQELTSVVQELRAAVQNIAESHAACTLAIQNNAENTLLLRDFLSHVMMNDVGNAHESDDAAQLEATSPSATLEPENTDTEE